MSDRIIVFVMVMILVFQLPIFAQASDEPPTAGGPQGENVIAGITTNTPTTDNTGNNESLPESTEIHEQPNEPASDHPQQETTVHDPTLSESDNPSDAYLAEQSENSKITGVSWRTILKLTMLSAYFIWNLLF